MYQASLRKHNFEMTSTYKNAIEENLANWENSLVQHIPIAGLLSRNPIAYKWKAPFRSWMLREAAFWRVHDLMQQSYSLYRNDHLLGARIILRSGFETLASLTYLNQITEQVLEETMSFSDWGEKTTKLLLGSRDNTEMPQSTNILTIFKKCEKRYPGLMKMYASLSESAHPSYQGLCSGYSKIDHGECETHFRNRWSEKYAARHLDLMESCMSTFHYEYNDVWIKLMEQLEEWIVKNNSELDSNKNDG